MIYYLFRISCFVFRASRRMRIQEGCMQFKVPQNIDLEDKIVGPLTLIQFVYCLVGGLICYIIYQLIPSYIGVVLLIDIPIALVALALAFLKIQDQPLSHFIAAGIQYFNKPKVRYWMRLGQTRPAISEAPVAVKKEITIEKRKIEKSDLEKLAYVLDTKPMQEQEQRDFGKITRSFEKMISSASQNGQLPQILNQQGAQEIKGGQGGAMGQNQTANR